ncbi:hypothetical protein MCOR32_005456 [Pyricularia oryzae]|nr:hypothetical protein MCOR32_005456 [Pyricularia oryzae]
MGGITILLLGFLANANGRRLSLQRRLGRTLFGYCDAIPEPTRGQNLGPGLAEVALGGRLFARIDVGADAVDAAPAEKMTTGGVGQ